MAKQSPKQFTATNVAARSSTFPPPPSGKPAIEYGDPDKKDGTRGFYLRVYSNNVRSFILRYRPKGGPRAGKPTVLTLGQVGEISLADARAKAEAARKAIKYEEADPAHDGKEAPAAPGNTYREVAARFIRQYARPRQRQWKETARVLGLKVDGDELRPIKGGLADPAQWGGRQFAEISSADADAYISALIEAGKEGAARVALSWIKTCWRWASRRGLADPVMDRLLAEDFGLVPKSRKIIYSDEQLKALWNVESDRLTSRERGFLRLLILLCARAGALAGMRKSELDSLEAPTLWTVPTERTKTRKSREEAGRVYLIPISPLARRVLLPLLEGEGDLVFPSAIRKGVVMDCGTPLAKKIREASGVSDWIAHGHRHTVGTWLQDHGHDEYDRALMLQHAGAGTVTGKYSHGYPIERARKVSEEWSGHIASIAEPEEAEALA